MNGLEKKFLLWELKILIKKASTMKLTWSTVFQALSYAGQYGTWAMNVVPANWKPFVSLGLGVISVVLHWRAGQLNPDGTPASVAYVPSSKNNFTGGSSLKLLAFAFALLLALAVPMHAQNAPIPTQTFSFNAAPISLPGNRGTFVGTDAGVTFNPTTNLDLAEHNILSSDGKLKSFMGGLDYACAACSTWLNNKMPVVSGFRIKPSIGGAFGIAQVTDANGNTVQHYSALIAGQLAYSLDSGGTWQCAIRVGAMRAPGYANGWVPVVSLPVSFNF